MSLTVEHSGLKGVYTPPETPRRQGFHPRSQSPRHKSVAFDLGSDSGRHPEPGYEADDSDSTDDSRHHSHRFSRSHSPPPFNDNDKSRSSPSSDSDSIIDLPDRFDSHGRLLTEGEREQPLGNSMQDMLDGMFA